MPEQAARSWTTYEELGEARRQTRDAAGPRGNASVTHLPTRRTIVIRGQVADRYAPPRRSRRSGAVSGYYGPRPDRAAKWAVLLGLLLVVVALVSAHL
jgi:hypothetical protein